MTGTETLPAEAPSTPPRPSLTGRIIGILGELLITVGVVIGLFVVWQVWWTDVQTDSVIASELEDFDGGSPTLTTPLDDADKRTDDAPAPEIPEDLTAQGIPPSAFAVLHVPRWGDAERVPIAEGVSLPRVLNKGFAGRYPDTGNLGQVGNFALAAHRQSYGAPFRLVDRLQVGDPLVVETEDAWYVYRVTGSDIVLPTQVDVISPNPADPGAPPTESVMTLTTCHPLFSTRERFIVHATFDYWAPRDAGLPPELGGA